MEANNLKICPLSFGFSVQRKGPDLTVPRMQKTVIDVGFPCIKAQCAWWIENKERCVMSELLEVFKF